MKIWPKYYDFSLVHKDTRALYRVGGFAVARSLQNAMKKIEKLVTERGDNDYDIAVVEKKYFTFLLGMIVPGLMVNSVIRTGWPVKTDGKWQWYELHPESPAPASEESEQAVNMTEK